MLAEEKRSGPAGSKRLDWLGSECPQCHGRDLCDQRKYPDALLAPRPDAAKLSVIQKRDSRP
jgi:hypothetical protein